MTVDELKELVDSVVREGPWDSNARCVMSFPEDEITGEVEAHDIHVGGYVDILTGAGTQAVAFACKFDDDPELFVLVGSSDGFVMKGAPCEIEESTGDEA